MAASVKARPRARAAGLALILLAVATNAAAAPYPAIVLEAQQTVLTKPQMRALGLASTIWSDSTLSLLQIGKDQKLYGTGGDSARVACDGLVGLPARGIADTEHPGILPRFGTIEPHHVIDGCLAASPAAPNIAAFQSIACQTNPACIAATPFDNDYSSMTSVIHLTNGWIAAFVHGENNFWARPGVLLGPGFYGRIGMYVSRDGGRTFTAYSTRPVIEGNITFADLYRQGPQYAYDPSGGDAILTRNGEVYVYYSDEYGPLKPNDPDRKLAAACNVCIAVAEISLDDLTRAVVAGRLPPLHKYYRGGFTQPALGGRFSPVISPELAIDPRASLQESFIVWPSVGYAAQQSEFVIAYMSGTGGTRMRTSPDGLTNWSAGAFISPHRPSDQPGPPLPAIPYPTIIGGGSDFHDIQGGDFYLYYQSSPGNRGFDWAQSIVARRRVSLEPSRYAHYTGYFSYTEGFAAYSNGQGHYCTIAGPQAFGQLDHDETLPYIAPHIEPTVQHWINDGACLS